MSKLHTIVIGTSKSKNSAVYYHDSKSKFWGLIHRAGITTKLLEPNEFKELIDKYGIGFGELAFDHVFLGEDLENVSITNDKSLNDQLDFLNIGVPKLIEHLHKVKPKRIVFNGKSATSVFYQFINNNKIDKVSASYANEQGFQFGKIGVWNDIEIWMMPNMSNAAGKSWKDDKGEDNWLKFWEIISKEIAPKKNNWNLYMLVGTILLALIIYFILK